MGGKPRPRQVAGAFTFGSFDVGGLDFGAQNFARRVTP